MIPKLIQYPPEVCTDGGYPFAWSHETIGEAPREGAPVQEYPFAPPIKDYIRELAGHRCQRCLHPYRKGEHGSGEWSPCDEQCKHWGPYRWRPVGTDAWLADMGIRNNTVGIEIRYDEKEFEAHWRILTVHHLDEDKGNCRWWNLAALCQRCHLRMQRAVIMDRPYHFEHSEWFKPYAAGFYAWKYLGEDLTREETMARLDELLKLEHRWLQEAIF